MERTLKVLFCLALLGVFAQVSAAGKVVYKWVDENGVVHYTASLPPEKVGTPHATLNSQGRVTGTVDAGMTTEEREALAELEEHAQQIDRQSNERSNDDRRLLATYRSEADIQQAKEQQITVAQGELKATQQGLREQLISLSSRVSLAAQAERAGQPVAEELKREIRSLQGNLGSRQTALQLIQQKIATLEQTFEEDMRRYRELVAPTAS